MIWFKITAKTGPGFLTLGEVRDQLARLRDEFEEAVQQELESFCEDFILERIRLNTPILTGNLRESLFVRFFKKRGRVSIVFGSDKPYALKQHELEHKLGKRSAAQPAQPEGGVGNKYIERVIDYHADSFIALLRRVPETILIQKRYKTGSVRTIREVE